MSRSRMDRCRPSALPKSANLRDFTQSDFDTFADQLNGWPQRFLA